MTEKTYNAVEVAERFGVTRDAVYKWVSTGQFGDRSQQNRYLFTESELCGFSAPPMGRPPGPTPRIEGLLGRIREMHDAGACNHAIATKLKISNDTVYRHLDGMGLAPPRRKRNAKSPLMGT